MNIGPIALLGLRCAGKSSVGRPLARLLGLPFLDLDEEIVRWGVRSGEPPEATGSAGALLARIGVPRFRAYESEVLRRVLEPAQSLVLATGGGVVERTDNRRWLARSARCIWLSVPPEILAERLRRDPAERPGLLGADPLAEIPALLERRAPHYLALAERVVDAGEADPAELARRLAEGLAAGP